MQNTLAKLFIGAVIVSIATAVAFGADNSLGTWKLNIEKSKFSPTPTVKSLSVTREASDGGVKVTTTGERADGTPINGYTVKYDGTEASVTGSGAPYDIIAVKQVNANTFTTKQKKSDGKYNATARIVISKDGKTMTNSVKGTNADGQAMNNVLVYDKQ